MFVAKQLYTKWKKKKSPFLGPELKQWSWIWIYQKWLPTTITILRDSLTFPVVDIQYVVVVYYFVNEALLF